MPRRPRNSSCRPGRRASILWHGAQGCEISNSASTPTRSTVAFCQRCNLQTAGRNVLANVASPQVQLVQRLNVHNQDLVSFLGSSVAVALDTKACNQVETRHLLVASGRRRHPHPGHVGRNAHRDARIRISAACASRHRSARSRPRPASVPDRCGSSDR